jgi:hypothetical protein
MLALEKIGHREASRRVIVDHTSVSGGRPIEIEEYFPSVRSTPEGASPVVADGVLLLP